MPNGFDHCPRMVDEPNCQAGEPDSHEVHARYPIFCTPETVVRKLRVMESFERPIVEQRLTSGQVAAMFGVNSGTVVRWARAGKIATMTTSGGHRRYRLSEVRELLRELESSGSDSVIGVGRVVPRSA
jgi:excisionase family DNA binding protein